MAVKCINRYAEGVLTCSEEQHYRGEILLADASLVRILSGELKVVQADRTHTFGSGDTLLFPRQQLATLIKYPQDGQPYKSVIMGLPMAVLRAYYAKRDVGRLPPAATGIRPLAKSPLLDGFFASILPYFELENTLPEKLAALKMEEAIEILRSLDNHLDGVLSDFSETGKINLADFMEQHYMFNIPLEQFSHLTGRSLTTFKRDFTRAFQTTPQRWLTRKRLELAHHHLAEKHQKPVDIYIETGFENLSHFSYAFKKHFGYSPTDLAGPIAKR